MNTFFELITAAFVVEFLNPANPHVYGYDFMRGLYAYCYHSTIIEIIRMMPYDKFLQTPYWRSISNEVKNRADNECTACGSKGILNTHHRYYNHHGEEIVYLRDLMCLCQKCHGKFHDLENRPNISQDEESPEKRIYKAILPLPYASGVTKIAKKAGVSKKILNEYLPAMVETGLVNFKTQIGRFGKQIKLYYRV